MVLIALLLGACTQAESTRVSTPIPSELATPTPTPVAQASWVQWEPLGGFPLDEVISALAVDPRDSNILYIGVESLGFLRSEDRGKSWRMLEEPTHHHLMDIKLDPADPDVVYYGGFDAVITMAYDPEQSGTASGWSLMQTVFQASAKIGSIAFDGEGTIYIGTSGSMFRSKDRLESWEALDLRAGANAIISSIAIDPRDSRVLYASSGHENSYGTSGGHGIFKTTNGGASWVAVNDGLSSLEANKVLLDPARPDTVYAATAKGVFSSPDGGRQWSESSRGLPSAEIWTLAMDPQQPRTIYAGTSGDGLYVTRDNADSWQKTVCCGDGEEVSHIFSIAFDPADPGTLLVGTGRGLFEVKPLEASFARIEGTYFDTVGADYGFGGVSALAVDPSNPSVILVAEESGRDMFRSTDGGSSWAFVGPRRRIEQWKHTYGMAIKFDPSNPNKVYYSAFDGLFTSQDSGSTWSYLSTVPPRGSAASGAHLHAIAIDPSDPNVLYVSTGSDRTTTEENHVFKTEDGGATWQKKSTGLPQDATTHIVQLLIDPENVHTLYLATTTRGYPGPWQHSAFGVYKSTNGGESWQARNRGLGDLGVNTLLFHPTDSATLYAGTQGGIYVSRNGGGSWEPLTNQKPLADAPVRAIVVLPSRPQVIFASVDESGVWVSEDSGRSWAHASDNMNAYTAPHDFCAALCVYQLVLDPQEKYLYATGLAGFTVFRALLP